jgi:GNAT superfamily N-acetyltransferase
MRAQDFVTEIERLRQGDYQGGKDEIGYAAKRRSGLTPLPGGSRYLYNITGNKQYPTVVLWDPEGTDARPRQPQPIGKLSLYSAEHRVPLPGALQVGTITVDEDYRGQGIARALYGVVLSIMRRPLISGDSQTPGGRRNWVGLNQIPGVEVRGWLKISDFDINPSYDSPHSPRDQIKSMQRSAEKRIDTLMGELGADYVGRSGSGHVFAFDVQPNRSGQELEAVVKTQLSRVYNEPIEVGTGLYAIWTGA